MLGVPIKKSDAPKKRIKSLSLLNVFYLKYSARLIAAGDFDGAEKVLASILDKAPNDIDTLNQFAELATARKDWNEAVTRWSRRLDVEKNNIPNIIMKLSDAYEHQGLPNDSIIILEGARACGLANSSLEFHLAKIYAENEDLEKAVRIVDNIILENEDWLTNSKFINFAIRLFWSTEKIEQTKYIIKKIGDKTNNFDIKTKSIFNEIKRQIGPDAHVFSEEVSKYYYDDVYKTSPKYKTSGNESIYLPVWKEVVELVNSRGYRNLLDLGCGPGQFAEYILGQVPDLNYTGVDFSSVAIEAAQQRCPTARFFQADMLSNGLIESFKFDAVLMLEVLEHLRRDRELLEKLPRGSYVIASVPNFDAFGHVRFFKNIDNVERRYAPLLLDLVIMPVDLENKSILFVMHGKVK